MMVHRHEVAPRGSHSPSSAKASRCTSVSSTTSIAATNPSPSSLTSVPSPAERNSSTAVCDSRRTQSSTCWRETCRGCLTTATSSLTPVPPQTLVVLEHEGHGLDLVASHPGKLRRFRIERHVPGHAALEVQVHEMQRSLGARQAVLIEEKARRFADQSGLLADLLAGRFLCRLAEVDLASWQTPATG